MSNLIRRQWYLLRHSLLFWGMVAAVLLLCGSSAFQANALPDAALRFMVPGVQSDLLGYFVFFAADSILHLLVIGAFTGLLIGQQFSSKAIEQEVAAGHTRLNIYASRCVMTFVYTSTALLIGHLVSTLGVVRIVPMPALVDVLPYLARTLPALALVYFSIVCLAILISMLFRSTVLSGAVSAGALFGYAMLSAAAMANALPNMNAGYVQNPSIWLLIQPFYLVRHMLRFDVMQQGYFVGVGACLLWIGVILGLGYCIFRRAELQ